MSCYNCYNPNVPLPNLPNFIVWMPPGILTQVRDGQHRDFEWPTCNFFNPYIGTSMASHAVVDKWAGIEESSSLRLQASTNVSAMANSMTMRDCGLVDGRWWFDRLYEMVVHLEHCAFVYTALGAAPLSLIVVYEYCQVYCWGIDILPCLFYRPRQRCCRMVRRQESSGGSSLSASRDTTLSSWWTCLPLQLSRTMRSHGSSTRTTALR